MRQDVNLSPTFTKDVFHGPAENGHRFQGKNGVKVLQRKLNVELITESHTGKKDEVYVFRKSTVSTLNRNRVIVDKPNSLPNTKELVSL